MKVESPQLKEAYAKVSLAEKAEASTNFKLAFGLYKDAVELLFPIGEGKRRYWLLSVLTHTSTCYIAAKNKPTTKKGERGGSLVVVPMVVE